MKFKYIILFSAVIFSFASCTKEKDTPIVEDGIRLVVSAPGVSVKAGVDKNGIQSLNENKINSIYYFLFSTGSESSEPVVKGHYAGLSVDGSTYEAQIPVSNKTILEDLFPVGVQTCRAFVIANPPSSLTSYLEGDSGLSLTNLRKTVFTSSLCGVQDSFVMLFDGDVSLSSRTEKVSATINAQMKRLADKISITAKVTQLFQDNITGDWEPQMDGVKATLYNALSKTNLSGTFSLLTGIEDEDYFESNEVSFGGASDISWTVQTVHTKQDSTVYGYQVKSNVAEPIYTYPMTWEFADRFEPYLLIELPWENTRSDGEGHVVKTMKSCWYKIMFSFKNITLNQWYDLTVKLDALGSFNKVEPVQQYLYEDYLVLGWNNAFETGSSQDFNVDADIKEARYLVVDNTDYELHNQAKLSIPFSSSHECDLQIVSATKTNFKTQAKIDVSSEAASWFSFSDSAPVLEFNHELNNTLGSGLDVSPYTIVLKLKHADNDSYFETITIVQYPSITISANLNSAVTITNAGLFQRDNTDNNTKNGYVFVNNVTNSTTQNYQYVNGATYMADSYMNGGENSCPYIYEIEVQALSDNSYVLRDPRVNTVNNPTGLSTAISIQGSNRALTNYYPADSEESALSPKFKIASSFGKCFSMSYSEAVKRCASYQEDGFPAGRWRLPTGAEIKFCVALSNNDLIQELFTSGSSYWCSNGYITINNAMEVVKDASSSYTPRCVYDSWYWDAIDIAANRYNPSETNSRPVSKTTFTWGDQAR